MEQTNAASPIQTGMVTPRRPVEKYQSSTLSVTGKEMIDALTMLKVISANKPKRRIINAVNNSVSAMKPMVINPSELPTLIEVMYTVKVKTAAILCRVKSRKIIITSIVKTPGKAP